MKFQIAATILTISLALALAVAFGMAHAPFVNQIPDLVSLKDFVSTVDSSSSRHEMAFTTAI